MADEPDPADPRTSDCWRTGKLRPLNGKLYEVLDCEDGSVGLLPTDADAPPHPGKEANNQPKPEKNQRGQGPL